MCQQAAAAKEQAIEKLSTAIETTSGLERQGLIREAVDAILEAASRQAPAESEHAAAVQEEIRRHGRHGEMRLHDGEPQPRTPAELKEIADNPDARD
jgi:hypothetical protein